MGRLTSHFVSRELMRQSAYTQHRTRQTTGCEWIILPLLRENRRPTTAMPASLFSKGASQGSGHQLSSCRGCQSLPSHKQFLSLTILGKLCSCMKNVIKQDTTYCQRFLSLICISLSKVTESRYGVVVCPCNEDGTVPLCGPNYSIHNQI